MEKLNQFAPYILIVCGALIAILSFSTQSNHTKGYIGLIFIGLGSFRLYQKAQNK
jgi:uncharacterized membrane protein